MSKYTVEVLKKEIKYYSDEEKIKYGRDFSTRMLGYEYVFETEDENMLFKFFLEAPNVAYRILIENRVLCFVHENEKTSFLKNFENFISIDKRVFDYNKSNEEKEKEYLLRVEEVKKLPEVFVDLENLNTYNGVEQVYDNHTMDREDFLNMIEEINEREKIAKTKPKVKVKKI